MELDCGMQWLPKNNIQSSLENYLTQFLFVCLKGLARQLAHYY